MVALKERLNGNTGLVITSGMIIFLVAIVTFGFVLVDRVDAITEIKVDNKMHQLKEEMTETLHSIDNRLAIIESKLESQ